MASTAERRRSTSDDVASERGERRESYPLLSRLARLRRALRGHAAAVVAVGAAACGEPAPPAGEASGTASESIIGGTLAAEGEFPAVVSLGGCSGTLVHPSLVVYAEHCGTAIAEIRLGVRADAPERVVATDRCRGFPGARLGDGTDLAYCVLEAPVFDVEPERILSGCELEDVARGASVTLVGYGIDRDGGAYGEKRVATSRIHSVGDELLLERGVADTCHGDSGGPVFIERREPDGTVQRRLVGVTSAGTEAECGRGVGHYVHLSRKLDWLEGASQLDLSPCFERGSWSPTAACVATGATSDAEESRKGEDASTPRHLRSCGKPFGLPADELPPLVEWTKPGADGFHERLALDATYAELELAVDASDTGWGVERVSFVLRDSAGRTLFQRDDEIAPYGLPLLRVPPGRFTLTAETTDFAGNGSSATVGLVVDAEAVTSFHLAGGCSWSRSRSASTAWAAVSVLLALLRTRRRRVA